MQIGVIERKVLGALLTMSDDNGIVSTNLANLASRMGYKKSGGALTFAIKILENENYISKQDKQVYKVLI